MESFLKSFVAKEKKSIDMMKARDTWGKMKTKHYEELHQNLYSMSYYSFYIDSDDEDVDTHANLEKAKEILGE